MTTRGFLKEGETRGGGDVGRRVDGPLLGLQRLKNTLYRDTSKNGIREANCMDMSFRPVSQRYLTFNYFSNGIPVFSLGCFHWNNGITVWLYNGITAYQWKPKVRLRST